MIACRRSPVDILSRYGFGRRSIPVSSQFSIHTCRFPSLVCLILGLVLAGALPGAARVQRLTTDDREDVAPSVNRAGHVVWSARSGTGSDIYLWDGVSVRKIVDNA